MLGWWCDEAAGVFGYHRIGHLPNADQAQICHIILTRDGRRYRRNTSLPFNPAWRTDRWRTEGLEAWFEKDDWQVAYQSPDCATRLTFSDYHSPVNTAEVAARVGNVGQLEHKTTASDGRVKTLTEAHLENGCRVAGSVVIGGDTIMIDAMGFRDHSWGGIRDMSHIRSVRWIVGTCGPQLSFGMAFCSTAKGEVMRQGWVFRDGVLHAVKHFDALVSFEMDGRSWRRGELWAELDDGSVLEWKSGDVWDSAVAYFDPLRSELIAAAPVTVNGLRGVINFQSDNNPTGGTETLVTALRACTTDGFSRQPAFKDKP